MTFENFENLFTLFCTIIGLLSCLFKYIENPKRCYLYLILFFLAHFLSDYYWTIYVLIMNSYPNVSAFIAYLGWNISYIILILPIINFREKKELCFNPVMLWPLITNIPLFFLFIQFGGILNNVIQVSATTIAMVLCTREIFYYHAHKEEEVRFPFLPLFILIYLVSGYCMWAVSCFEWESEITNPYLFFTIIVNVTSVFFATSAGKDFENDSQLINKKSEAEIRLQTLIQTIISFVILGTCAFGYFIVTVMKKSLPSIEVNENTGNSIIIILFITSIVLIVLVSAILLIIAHYYKIAKNREKTIDVGHLSRLNFYITATITLILMSFAVVYNTRLLYKTSVPIVYENGNDKVRMYSTELENYLTEAETTLRITADTIDIMNLNGASSQEVYQFLVEQSSRQAELFDENFTGIYAYINNRYMDGIEWVPPDDYDVFSRPWYKTAVQENGKVTIVSPYVDANTGKIVITITKQISDHMNAGNAKLHNVVSLDVYLNHIQEITDKIDIAGKGFGMVINNDGFIVSHHDKNLNGKNVSEVYSPKLLSEILDANNKDNIQFAMENENYTFFVCPILNQWYAAVAIGDSELFGEVQSQLIINIIISMMIFALILFFYYLGYKNERNYGKKVEEMNIQVVSALASAIDAKDTYTNGHSSRVAEYSRMIASQLGYSQSRLDEIYMMALLHDVGKIGVPDNVINKNGKLTPEEYELIKKHPVIGSNILQTIKEKQNLSIGARWHHERYEGGGYPDGIAGQDIPEEARIIAVADAYDAMTSKRSYREIMPQDKVRSEIEKGMWTQFDPQFAAIMLNLIDQDKDYTMCGK